MEAILSIGIPTYNRKEQLIKQLNSLIEQDLVCVEEILVIDNHSSYNVEGIIEGFNTNKIRLIRNPFNVRMSTNIMSPFYFCRTKWLWLLSDDDEATTNAIKFIHKEILNSSERTGMIKFSIEKPLSTKPYNNERNKIVYNLESFIDYYYEEKNIRRGDLVFMSNAVYNISILRPYLGFGFEYSYTFIPYLIPVIMALNEKTISVVFSEKTVVKYFPPKKGGWSFITVGKGLSVLSHLPLSLSPKYKKKFLNIVMLLTPKALLNDIYINNKQSINRSDYKIIYNNIYRYYLPFKDKLLFKLLLFASSNCLKVIFNKLIKLRNYNS